MNVSPITAHVLENFKDLCVPTESKIDWLLAKYAHLGAYYQEARVEPRKSTNLAISPDAVEDGPPWEDGVGPSFYQEYVEEPEDAGVVIPAKVKAKKLIISHIDLVSTFERGFALGKTFEVQEMFEDLTYVRGGLDNGITNAFLCTLLDLEALPDDVEVLFSLGEESGLTGVTEYLRSKPVEYFDDLFVINLDVSNENFGTGASSIEFDFADPVLCEQMLEAIPNTAVTLDRFCDDTSAVLEFTHAAMSFCIPTDEYCHTYKSCAILEFFDDYYSGLKTLVCDMPLPYSSENAAMLQDELQKELAARKGNVQEAACGFDLASEDMFRQWLLEASSPQDPLRPKTK